MRTAMILAAGRGERLKPLTNQMPKALCPVQNKPLIVFHLEKLAKAGFKRIVINHAYLGGKIRHYLGNGSPWSVEICYTPEPPGGLETGGGIFNALPWFEKEPFLTVNADIFTDYEFSLLPPEAPILAKLVLVPNPEHNSRGDFGLTNNLVSNEPKLYTFAGIAYYRPELFSNCWPGRYSVTPIIREFVEQKKVMAELYQGNWIDIGSRERLELARAIKRGS